MDPFTIALATFGVQKLRGKSTGRSLRDAAMAAGIGYGIGQFAGGAGLGIGQGSPFSTLGFGATTAIAPELAATQAAQGGIGGLSAGTGGQFAEASLLEPVSVANPGSFLTNYSAMPTAAADGITSYGAAGSQEALASKAAADAAAGQLAQQGLYTTTPNVATPEPNWFMKNIVGSSPTEGQAYKPKILVDGVVKQPEIPYIAADKGSGFLGLGTGAKLGIGVGALSALPLLMPEEEEKPLPGTTPEERAAAQAAANEQIGGLTSSRGAMPTYSGSPYNYGSNYYRFNTGGIVSALPKFSVGGVNYLPSKQTHDENDVHNYVRATGYVEDGSGNGDKDEDTILAQLADGEFVSRADAILGAGIMEGASPSSMKDMRKKGAAFFYDQQAKFKRVYDLLDASRKNN
jgi:hypothetical protein